MTVLICPNCRAPLAPGAEVCPNCGLILPQPSEEDTIIGPVVPRPPKPEPSPRVSVRLPRRLIVIAVSVLVVCAVLGAAVFFGQRWIAQQRLEAARLLKARQIQTAHTLKALRRKYTASHFGLYPGDKGRVTLNAHLSACAVRTLDFDRHRSTTSVTVGLIGIRADSEAPTVYVTLFASNGKMLSRAPIVKFWRATLQRGETRDITDKMDLSSDADPAIVAVDEGKGATP